MRGASSIAPASPSLYLLGAARQEHPERGVAGVERILDSAPIIASGPPSTVSSQERASFGAIGASAVLARVSETTWIRPSRASHGRASFGTAPESTLRLASRGVGARVRGS